MGILLKELRNELRREYPEVIPMDQQTIDPKRNRDIIAQSSAPSSVPGSNTQSSAQPVAPVRNRRNKRANDERSPPVLPASQYQKLADEQMNTSYGVPTSKSLIKATITPPIGDLFAILVDHNTPDKRATKLLDDNIFALPIES